MDENQTDLPEWTDDPVDRLRHVLALHADEVASTWVHRCSGEDDRFVGLTWEDLRLILAELDEAEDLLEASNPLLS